MLKVDNSNEEQTAKQLNAVFEMPCTMVENRRTKRAIRKLARNLQEHSKRVGYEFADAVTAAQAYTLLYNKGIVQVERLLARLHKPVVSETNMGPIVGDIWEPKDKRRKNRYLVVEGMTSTHALCRGLETNAAVKIKLDRITGRQSEYRLVASTKDMTSANLDNALQFEPLKSINVVTVQYPE